MKTKLRAVLAVVLGLAAGLIAPPASSWHPVFVPHPPISINGNLFPALGPAYGIEYGSGTQSDPFLIHGWDISDASTLSNPTFAPVGIRISNTNQYYLIHTVYVHDFDDSWIEAGIHVQNAPNVEVFNSILERNRYGVLVESRPGNVYLHGNTITESRIGVEFENTECYHCPERLLTLNNVIETTQVGVHAISAVYVQDSVIRHVPDGSSIWPQPAYYGVFLDEGDDSYIASNMVECNPGVGVKLTQWTSSPTIVNNRFSGCNPAVG